MASLGKDAKGYSVVFRDPHTNAQRRIRLGAKMAERTAQSMLLRIERLITAKAGNTAIDQETATWLAGAGPVFRAKLHRAGLCEAPAEVEKPRLGKFLNDYLATRTDLKEGTLRSLRITAKAMSEFFGPAKPLADITPGCADEFRLFLLQTKGENTTRRMCGRAKQFFAAAKRKKLIDDNPFTGVKTNVQGNPHRMKFASPEAVRKVIDAATTAEWRLLLALGRWGGLRIPSEIQRMKWQDIHWAESRFIVHSPKTEHHVGGESRNVPLWPELVPFLEDVQELNGSGEYVFSEAMRKHSNPGTTVRKFIQRAGVKDWGKPFQNLRSTRETELAEKFPMHKVCRWLGNSQPVAMKHYMQETASEYQDAVLVVTQVVTQEQETPRTEPQQKNSTDSEVGALQGVAEACEDMHKRTDCPVRIRT